MSAAASGRRFGPIGDAPPRAVVDALPYRADGWTRTQFGTDDQGFPNGGIWRFSPDDSVGRDLMVKRTGPAYLGGNHVWSLSRDPASARWWGREASFYSSDLARSGWPAGCRAPRSWIDDHAWLDDHGGFRDIWLEAADGLPAALEVCERAVRGLAHWQVANAGAQYGWLAEDWIAEHVGRYHLDNDRTLAHPAWPSVLERGLDPAWREVVAERPTDPETVRRRLAEFPQLLTHHDFHNNNLGTVDGDVVIFDWAFVGFGPIGHDVGQLALTMEPLRGDDPAVAWRRLSDAYCDALADAGSHHDPEVIRRSIAVSNQLRLGWMIDEFLNNADRLDAGMFTAVMARLECVRNAGR